MLVTLEWLRFPLKGRGSSLANLMGILSAKQPNDIYVLVMTMESLLKNYIKFLCFVATFSTDLGDSNFDIAGKGYIQL